MKLNIVTGSSNSLGKSFLKNIANTEDITIWLSRRWCNIPNVINLQVDLLDSLSVKKELLKILSTIDSTKISSVHLIHTASKIKNELHDIPDPKYNTIDLDGDWIDDDVLHCTYTTFVNTHQALIECLQNIWKSDVAKYVNIIGTLLDKKSRTPSSHKSMVSANKLLRNYIIWLCHKDKSYKWNCVSVWTIATESELAYRKNGEHKYWLKEDVVVQSILERNVAFVPWYTDEDRYEHNPRYLEYYKDETDEQMNERFKKEIGLI